jgi:molybdopterin-containing oxidoreductase family iron-sulfur binding subunit
MEARTGASRKPPEGGPANDTPCWRSLEELADSEGFRRWARHGGLESDGPWNDPVRRRQFLSLLAASLGLAGLGGCDVQPPGETILPYVRQPEEMVLGRSLFFATTAAIGGDAVGLLVESREGRPTKIEGNPQHPASLGGTDALVQAAVLGVYDPDRSQTVRYRGQIRSWDDAQEAIAGAMAAQRPKKGAGLRLLTEPVTSPTLAAQIGDLLARYPRAEWHQYEPAGRDGVRQGALLALGEDVSTQYRFDRAEVVLSLDADFLASGPGHLRYAREFAARRTAPDAPPAGPWNMNRLYMVQSTPTISGAKADHCWPLRAAEVETFARRFAAALDGRLPPPAAGESLLSGKLERAAGAILRDLRAHAGACLVIAGDQQPAAVHALAHAMNHALGNVGKTVIYSDPVEARPEDQIASLRRLVDAMDRGQVELLVILGGNPALTAPRDLAFAERLLALDGTGKAKVPLRIHLGLYEDETSARCDWHLPEAHFLESWGDARAYDGTASIVQPLIAPLYGGKSSHELVAALAGQPQRPVREMVRDHWRGVWESRQPSAAKQETVRGKAEREDAFARFWKTALHEGVVAGTAAPPKAVSLKDDWFRNLPAALAPAAGAGKGEGLELIFRPDPALFDGRFANNGWLQELPKPLTRMAWGNALLMSPAVAERFGLSCRPSGHGGEHGEATADVVELRYGGAALEVPIWPLPGHPDGSLTLHFGHGRTLAGNVGNGVGVDAYRLRTSAAPWFGAGAEIRKTGKQSLLACTQYHHLMEGRDPVHVGTPGEYQKARGSIAAGPAHAEAAAADSISLYPGFAYEGYRWGMAIDLSACIGCGACVAACQAENNIPVVGKEQVMRGREMHWIRVDRYYQGGAENPKTYFQPVPCMQCENAPCELVCPVEATVHSAEGLNDMVYNRCVGTRYCSNNCPYKVRRFNFLAYADFHDPALAPARNPEVTVRSRGVMEKCTYCVQRITQARIRADREDRRIRDGEVVTACQAACPARAISFGDLNDPRSRVRRRKALARDYRLLDELNTRPRTSYLAGLENPNPEIEAS